MTENGFKVLHNCFFSNESTCNNRCLCAHSESEESGFAQNMRQCNNQPCDQLCRRMGFNGGKCVGDHCSCNLFLHGNTFVTKINKITR